MPIRKVKDYKGVFRRLGASNHVGHSRAENDYYATEPKATEWLLRLEKFNGPILEPACGEGHISEVLKEHGYKVVSRDLVDRGYGEVADFLKGKEKWQGDIVTNPPYNYAQEFVEKALDMVEDGCKVAMFLKVLFLEGKKRKLLYKKHPPKRVWVSSSRLKCSLNGSFDEKSSGAVAYAWFIWEKGFKGDTVIKWFN